MKKMMQKIFLFCLVFNSLYAQLPQNSTCGMPAVAQQTATFSNIGGRYITTEGTITSFILFVRFSDDNETTPSWTNATSLPTWAQNLLNPTYNLSGAYTSNSFSHYIFENSYGKLHIVGDMYYVTLPQTESWYYQNSANSYDCREKIQQDAFDQLALIPGIDLSKYDNWKRTSEFTHVYTGPGSGQTKDNVVDMSWVILRNFHDDVYSSTVKLGLDIASLYASKTIGGVTLQSGYPGSGISMFMHNFIDQMPKQTPIQAKISEMDNDGSHHTIIGTMVHELSHYFFGGGHFGALNLGQYFGSNRSGSGIGPYSCNSGGNVGTIMGYEKIRLGWITSSEIKTITTNESFTLQDMETATSGFKIAKIPLDATQFIYLENRSWVSQYEARYVFSNFGKLFKPGILAYLIPNEYDYLSSTAVQMICADGKWDWIRLAGSGAEGPIDVISKTTPNSYSGYDEKEYIFIPAHPLGKWLAAYFPNSYGYWGRWYKGDSYLNETQNTGDYFGDDKKFFGVGDVITKWSNGASHKRSTSNNNVFEATEIGIEMMNFNTSNSSYTIQVRTSSPENLSPSKPQNISVTSYSGGKFQPAHARVSWNANTEPDMYEYEIYRAAGSSGFGLLTTVPYTQTYYNDAGVNVGSGGLNVYYKIKAKDTQNKISVFSDGVTIGSSNFFEKRGQLAAETPEKMELLQNYPNPFNPSTKISYSVPEISNVKISVYDRLGREITTVVNREHQVGYYEANFDASTLSSGVYFYTIKAGKFSETRKMTLMK